MTSCILKQFNSVCNKTVYHNIVKYIGRRTILSSSYQCQEVWKDRLKSQAMQKLDVGDFVIKLHDKLDKSGAASPIDIDIFVNKLSSIDTRQLDFAQSVLQRYRKCNASLGTYNSTSYGLIRNLLELGETQRILDIIQDKPVYGIFLDVFITNILLDHFIKTQQYHEAAKIAIDQMLQEDLSHPITHALSWYACDMTLRSPAPISEEVEEEEQEEDEDEEELIPVNYINSPFYDDHFDIPEDSMKIGKTLVALTRGKESPLCRSYQLMGWALYQKFETGLAMLDEWASSGETCVLGKYALDKFQELLENIESKETPTEEKDPGSLTVADLYPYINDEQKQQYLQDFQRILGKSNSSLSIEDIDLSSELESHVKSVVSKHEANDITQQVAQLKQWDAERQQNVEKQMHDYYVNKRKEELATKLEEIQAKEEKLRYFEEEEKIALGIARAPKMMPIEEVKEEELFVAAPGERGRKMN